MQRATATRHVPGATEFYLKISLHEEFRIVIDNSGSIESFTNWKPLGSKVKFELSGRAGAYLFEV
jgi:hypothetical protein